MRFALLGYDDDVLDLTRAALEAGHELSGVFEVEEQPPEFPRALDDFPPGGWEELLLGTLADFVIVSHGDYSERRADALRKLIQQAVPLIVVQPACEAIVGFELEMIRTDTKSLVLPYSTELFHSSALTLGHLVRGGLGRIEQVAVERTLFDRSRAAVLRQLIRDTGLVRSLLGPIRKVSALGAGATSAERLANLSVHMTTGNGTLVRWSMGPATDEPLGTVVVTSETGKAVLSMPHDRSAWNVTSPRRKSLTGAEDPETSPAHEAITFLVASIKSAKKDPPGLAEVWQPSTLLEACRDVEVAETAERSLLKGKTLELYHEEHSEKNTFMGMMAAGGCLLLSITLMLFVFVAILGGAEITIGKSWPVVVFAILGGFMLLQLLLLVFRGEQKKRNASLASTDARGGNSGQD